MFVSEGALAVLMCGLGVVTAREGREARRGTNAEVSHASTELGAQLVLWTLPVPLHMIL